MTDIAAILGRLRALGADVALERGRMVLIKGHTLTPDQRSWLAKHRDEIERHLHEVTAPPPLEDDTPPLTWGQVASILYAECPEGCEPSDWSWFVTEAGRIMRTRFGIGEKP